MPAIILMLLPFDGIIMWTWKESDVPLIPEKFEIFNKYRCETTELESSPILWRKDKFECIKTGYFWLSDTPEVESKGWDEEYDCYRMCVYVILQDKESGYFSYETTNHKKGVHIGKNNPKEDVLKFWKRRVIL